MMIVIVSGPKSLHECLEHFRLCKSTFIEVGLDRAALDRGFFFTLTLSLTLTAFVLHIVEGKWVGKKGKKIGCNTVKKKKHSTTLGFRINWLTF